MLLNCRICWICRFENQYLYTSKLLPMKEITETKMNKGIDLLSQMCGCQMWSWGVTEGILQVFCSNFCFQSCSEQIRFYRHNHQHADPIPHSLSQKKRGERQQRVKEMEGKEEREDEIRWTGKEAVMKWNDKGRIEEKTGGREDSETALRRKRNLTNKGKDNIKGKQSEPQFFANVNLVIASWKPDLHIWFWEMWP